MKVADLAATDLRPALRDIPQRIEEARLGGKKVLVHCAAGVSRSSSLVLGYLITFRGMTLRQAHDHLKAVRPIIRPNNGFWKQLVELETELKGETTITLVNVNGGEGITGTSSLFSFLILMISPRHPC